MDAELIQPTATLTVEILRRVATSNGQLTPDDIASAFEEAHLGLERGIARIDRKEARERAANG